MKVEIVYDSRTGTTAKAAEAMGKALAEHGHPCQVQSVAEADPADVSEADLICVGSWTQGLFIILQHPTQASMEFIDRLGDLAGKEAVVFCTYKLATGTLLPLWPGVWRAKGRRSSVSSSIAAPIRAVSSHRLPPPYESSRLLRIW